MTPVYYRTAQSQRPIARGNSREHAESSVHDRVSCAARHSNNDWAFQARRVLRGPVPSGSEGALELSRQLEVVDKDGIVSRSWCVVKTLGGSAMRPARLLHWLCVSRRARVRVGARRGVGGAVEVSR